jgi:Flp pilus assembly protein TadD
MPHARLLILISLSILTLAAYWSVTGNGFINYDDQAYVTDNRHVQKGLGLEEMVWAFTASYLSNWHPMTWLSLMLDRELYGVNAGGYHGTNVVLHLAAGLLLFSFLFRTTDRLWPSGTVAGLFLIHPLHVESVAWVAERKDVLSGLFWMLSLWCYAGYAQRPRLGRYLWVVLFFVLGLMSKPMGVTLPFVLLLLDYWPLGRIGFSRGRTTACGRGDASERLKSGGTGILLFPQATLKQLILEKVPLFAITSLSSIITYIAQQEGEAVVSLHNLPFADRMGNAVVSYAAYLVKMFWPFNLAVIYSHPGKWPTGEILLSLGLMLLITGAVLAKGRRHSYLPVGWFWYLGTLVPVIGLVQVGGQAMADRYTYLPLIGIFIAVSWGFADLLPDGRCRRAIAGAVLASVMTALVFVTQIQVEYWKSSLTLFGHAILVTENNYQAHNHLARALAAEKRFAEAEDHYREAIRIRPTYMQPYLNLGLARMEQGMFPEALACFSEALKIKPGDGEAHLARGNLYLKKELWDAAVVEYRLALKEKPYDSMLRNNLGLALTRTGDVRQAMREFHEAIRLIPEHAGAHNNLAMLLMGKGQVDEAIGHFQEAIRHQPEYASAHYRLAMALKQKGAEEGAAYHLHEARRINSEIESAIQAARPRADGQPEGVAGR